MNIEMVKVGDVKAYEKNPKQHPQEQIDKIASSILSFGFNVPIILDNPRDKTLVAGHGRLLGAIKAGLTEIPAIFATHLTPSQIRAYRIIDNKIAESGYSSSLLVGELRAMEEEHLSILGLTKDDLTQINEGDDVNIHNLGQSAPMFEYRLFFQDQDLFDKFVDLSAKLKEERRDNLSNSLTKLLEEMYG